MKKNMGGTDRIIRLLVAAIFAVLYFRGTVTGTFGTVLLVIGGVFVATSFINFARCTPCLELIPAAQKIKLLQNFLAAACAVILFQQQ